MISQVNQAFGMNFDYSEIEKIKGIPLYMTARRKIYKVYDKENAFAIIKLPEDEKFGVIALEKQKLIYEEKMNLPIAFLFESTTKTQRDSLINHHIPFISSDNQIYLPFLGILFHNKFKVKKEINIESMMPITQSLFLFLIYNCKDRKILKKDAADFLGVTRTSITRASDQLYKMGLIEQKMDGKEYYMWLEDSAEALFAKAKDYLINPIQDIILTEDNDMTQDYPLAGESALAEVSMLNIPKIKSIAIDKAINKSQVFQRVDERWEDDKTLVKIELWKYNPNLFAKNGIIDPISLYMTLKDNEDERITGALEEFMEELSL